MIPPIAYDKTGDLIIVIIHYFCQKTIKDVVNDRTEELVSGVYV
jgi:hypothetical protein